MADFLAVWGAVTGTIGTAVAFRREAIARRRRLAIRHGVHFNVRRDVPGHVNLAWALVSVWNTGGRPLSVEHVGFRYFVIRDESDAPETVEHRAEIALDHPIELAVDGPSERVGTPLGELMKAGVDTRSPIQAFAVTTGEKEWFGTPKPLVEPEQAITIGSTPDRLIEDLNKLAETSELPAATLGGTLIALKREAPYLPET